MKNAPDLVAHCLELLSPLGTVRARSMFGGHGVYVDQLFVALIADDILYLKADALARPAFAEAGCQPFSYSTAAGRRGLLAFWSAPGEAMESPQAMRSWARLAVESALRAAAARKPARTAQSAQAAKASGRRRAA